MTPGNPSVLVLADPAGAQTFAAEVELDVRFLASASADLADALPGCDVLVVFDCHPPELPAAWRAASDASNGLPRLTWVHTSSAGPDRLLFGGLRDHPAVLTCSRGVLDADIAEYVLAYVLAVVKDLPTTVRLQDARRWEHRVTRSLAGMRALVVGAGSIGSATASLLRAAGLEVDGVVRRSRAARPPFGRLLGPAQLWEHAGDYDLVVVTAPLTPATVGLVDAGTISRLRPGAIVVNVGRGPVVDEDALLAALASQRLGGVVLDVFGTEPLPVDSPWWTTPGAVVSPHMAGDTTDYARRLAQHFSVQLARFVGGEPLLHVVDPATGYVDGTGPLP